MPTYNKLVRDRIPFIIASTGKECRTRILNPEEYTVELKVKLHEESEEYFKADNDQEALEELADMLEVIRSLEGAHGSDWTGKLSMHYVTGMLRTRFISTKRPEESGWLYSNT